MSKAKELVTRRIGLNLTIGEIADKIGCTNSEVVELEFCQNEQIDGDFAEKYQKYCDALDSCAA